MSFRIRMPQIRFLSMALALFGLLFAMMTYASADQAIPLDWEFCEAHC